MKMHRTCLFAAAALGAVVLFGCASPTTVTKFDKAKDLQDDAKYSDAIANYKQFIAEKEYKELLPYAQYEIARCYKSLGQMSEARMAYEKVEEMYPTSEPAQWAKDELKDLEKMMQMTPPAKPMTGSMAKPMAPASK